MNIGDKFGDWTIAGPSESKQVGAARKIVFLCQCSCGKTQQVQKQNLRSGATKRCYDCRLKNLSPPAPRRIPDGQVNINGCFGGYERGAARRGIPFLLTLEEFLDFSQKFCHYCGEPPSNIYDLKNPKTGQSRGGKAFIYNGLDRVDNRVGYSVDNCVSCCAMCNKAKGSLSYYDFLALVGRVYRYLLVKGEQYVETVDSCGK